MEKRREQRGRERWKRGELGEGKRKFEVNGREERRCRGIENILRLNINHYHRCFFATRYFPNGLPWYNFVLQIGQCSQLGTSENSYIKMFNFVGNLPTFWLQIVKRCLKLWNNDKIFLIDGIVCENYSPDSFHLKNRKIDHFQGHVTSGLIRLISLITYVLCLDILSPTLFSKKTWNYSQ